MSAPPSTKDMSAIWRWVAGLFVVLIFAVGALIGFGFSRECSATPPILRIDIGDLSLKVPSGYRVGFEPLEGKGRTTYQLGQVLRQQTICQSSDDPPFEARRVTFGKVEREKAHVGSRPPIIDEISESYRIEIKNQDKGVLYEDLFKDIYYDNSDIDIVKCDGYDVFALSRDTYGRCRYGEGECILTAVLDREVYVVPNGGAFMVGLCYADKKNICRNMYDENLFHSVRKYRMDRENTIIWQYDRTKDEGKKCFNVGEIISLDRKVQNYICNMNEGNSVYCDDPKRVSDAMVDHNGGD